MPPDTQDPSPATAPAVGDRYTFVGLHGQQPYPQALPGSGCVGSTLEVTGISPWGSVSLTLHPNPTPLGETASRPHAEPRPADLAVGLADVMAMISTGVWEPLTEQPLP
jgi:hypothetical protein